MADQKILVGFEKGFVRGSDGALLCQIQGLKRCSLWSLYLQRDWTRNDRLSTEIQKSSQENSRFKREIAGTLREKIKIVE